MKKTLFLGLIGLLLLTPAMSGVASAQTVNPPCAYTLPFDLHVGSTDASSEGSVSVLQNFLVSKMFLTMPVGVPTGYFGNLTRSALASFQASVGISPAVGYFGPITRAYINSHCGTVYSPISISSISPSQGPVGTKITVSGNGFTPTGNTVKFGNYDGGAATYVNSQTITFTLPEWTGLYCSPGMMCIAIAAHISPGIYPVSVINSNGTSNAVNFTVTPSTSNSNVVINSVSGPTSLGVKQVGTWTISATDPQNGQLTYAVNWGEPQISSQATAGTSAFQQTTSFTHSYSQPGTYTVNFIVRNNNGSQAETSMTVQVTGSSSTISPVLSQVSPNAGAVNTQVTLYGSGFTATGNRINFSGGEYYTLSNLSSSNGTSLTFNIPSANDPACAHTTPQCYVMSVQTSTGNHTISVTNANGTSNSVNFNVTSSQSVATSLSQLSPSSGRIGTVVTIFGSGFTSSNNLIKWRGATITTVNANNNGTLTFVVPSSYGPTYTDGPTYQTGLGSYDVVVQNANGTSNPLYFSVTN